MPRPGLRFRGSKRRLRRLERSRGRAVRLWLLVLVFVVLEALALAPWLVFDGG